MGRARPRRRQLRALVAEHAPGGRVPAGLEPACSPAPGYVAPHWPAPWGLDADPAEQLAIDEVMRELAVPKPLNPIGIGLGRADAARRRHRGAAAASGCPGILDGSELWCQLFSEPGAGSDLASLQTRAVRDGDEYVVNGQKVWTTLAHVAHFGILLARTDPDAPAQEGITYFVVDMRTPGIEVRPLVQMTGTHEFNEVFFTDVRVPGRERRRRRARRLAAREGDARQRARVALGRGRAVGPRPDRQRRARPRARARRHARPPSAPAARAALHRVGGAAAHPAAHAVGARLRGVSSPGPEASVRKALVRRARPARDGARWRKRRRSRGAHGHARRPRPVRPRPDVDAHRGTYGYLLLRGRSRSAAARARCSATSSARSGRSGLAPRDALTRLAPTCRVARTLRRRETPVTMSRPARAGAQRVRIGRGGSLVRGGGRRRRLLGTSTRPICFIRFLPSFWRSSSLRLRVMSPP